LTLPAIAAGGREDEREIDRMTLPEIDWTTFWLLSRRDVQIRPARSGQREVIQGLSDNLGEEGQMRPQAHPMRRLG